MPLFASSKRPRRGWVAPVKAPRSCPKSSDSTSSSGSAAQFTATNGISRRGPLAHSARATSSLPVPCSPTINTRAMPGPTRRICSSSSRIAGDRPTIGTAHDSSGPRRSAANVRVVEALRSVWIRCSSESGFSTKSNAPRRVARTAFSIVPWPDIMTTVVPEWRAMISGSRSRPLPSGNHTSSRTKSKASSRSFRASASEPAVAAR